MKRLLNLATIFIILLIIASCGSEDRGSSGSGFDYVKTEPPVTRNTPSILQNDSEAKPLLKDSELFDLNSKIDSIKDEVFLRTIGRMGNHDCKGLVHCALKNIDSEMIELDNRAKEFDRACLNDTPIENVISIPLGNVNVDFVEYLQCADELSVPEGEDMEQWLGFGKNENKFYLHFSQSLGIMYLATVDINTENVEAWIVEDNTTPYHLISYNDSKILEITGAYECGFHMKTNQEYIYLTYFPEDYEETLSTTNACLSATDLSEVDISYCESNQLNEFDLETIITSDLDKQAIMEIAKDLSVIKALTSFNE